MTWLGAGCISRYFRGRVRRTTTGSCRIVVHSAISPAFRLAFPQAMRCTLHPSTEDGFSRRKNPYRRFWCYPVASDTFNLAAWERVHWGIVNGHRILYGRRCDRCGKSLGQHRAETHMCFDPIRNQWSTFQQFRTYPDQVTLPDGV